LAGGMNTDKSRIIKMDQDAHTFFKMPMTSTMLVK
jgi:hypothetical protein